MSINASGPINGSQNAAAGGSVSGGTSTQDLSGKNTFLQLLVAQLRNQDPMQPMSDQSFITELAQFNSVEQTLNLTQTVTSELSAQQATQAVSMLGKNITYAVPGVNGTNATSSQGIVTGVSLLNGKVQLEIGTQSIPLSEVTAVTA